MMRNGRGPVLVLGAGGHAKVVISTLRAAGIEVEAAYDDDPAKAGSAILGVQIRGRIAELRDAPGRSCVAAIGLNAVRQEVVGRFRDVDWISVCHPAAWVHPSVALGAGTVVFAGAIIQPDTRIGSHVIVNTSASVDHDCEIEDFAHLAPGTRLGGAVRVGRGALLGLGSSVLPGIRIGAEAVLGAGAVLIADLSSGTTAAGVPAGPLLRSTRSSDRGEG